MAENESRKSITESLDVLGVAKVAPEVYKDLLQPAAKHLGQDLVVVARAVSACLAPLKAAVWGFDQIQDWLSVTLTEKLAERKAKNIQPPPPNVAGPAILNLRFVKDMPDLREMYANLLASAMDAATMDEAHPSFVQVIEQLSADEAKLLGLISSRPDAFPLQEETEAEVPRLRSDKYVYEQWESLCAEVGVAAPRAQTCMDNLLRLRLLEEHRSQRSTLVPAGHNRYGTYEAHIDESVSTIVFVTHFGELFIKACVRQLPPSEIVTPPVDQNSAG